MSIEVGQRIGDYQILAELGSGGMGKVYKVRNVLSDRVEAMKVLLPDVGSREELAARFLREIKVLASLNHPNIAALRTALTMDNQLLMIMEYVDGVTLADRLRSGPIPVADTLRYMDQVLDALSYAHRQNVIHRDIKPANIILTTDGVIKLMDFGIARSGNERSLTMTGTTLGSVSYMSPEQVRGEATDARSDLYSLGITFYELVTGQCPFQAHSDYSIMTAHVKEAPKPPIELQSNVPPALNEIILMAIAKDPNQRFQTADAMRKALDCVERPALATAANAATPADAVTAPLSSLPAQPATTRPVPLAQPQATPIASAPNSVPMPVPPPSHPATHRGLYMTLGALIVLAVLVVAGIYVPRMSKTQAETSPQTPSTPVSNATHDSTQPPAQPTASPDAAAVPAATQEPATNAAQSAGSPAAPPENGMATSQADSNSEHARQPVPAAETSKIGLTPAAPKAASRSKSQPAGAMVNAGMQESATAPAAAPTATTAADTSALDELQQQADQLSNRTAAVDSSLDRLQQQQNASGFGMRGDIVSKHASLKTNLSRAESALQQKDAAKAKKYLDQAQGDLEALEHFLGH